MTLRRFIFIFSYFLIIYFLEPFCAGLFETVLPVSELRTKVTFNNNNFIVPIVKIELE